MTGSAAVPLVATYRLQMNAGFTLAHARARVDYFARLGVSHLYLSPVLAARRGSMHGYDVVDPTRINPELGTEADLRELATELRARNMGILLDIVPNHMGIGAENRYWDDVLAHGERSRYARWFDIEWAPREGGHHQVVLPVLGDDLDRVLERGELSLRVSEGEMPRVMYYENSFPVDDTTLPPELQLAQFDAEEAGEIAATFSGVEGKQRLAALLAHQHYRLINWRRGPVEINYRRFFDVNDLVALRMEDPAVFEETHAFVLQLVRDGVVDGLRVDHVDGLLDPRAYLERLRACVPPRTPIVVEKILSSEERFPRSWPVQGTTGYEFLNDLEDVFIAPDGFEAIERCYRTMRRLGDASFARVAHDAKVRVLTGPLRADVARLARLLAPITRGAKRSWSSAELEAAIVEFIAALPVYRTYIGADGCVSDDDRRVIEVASPHPEGSDGSSREAPAASGLRDVACVQFLRDLLLDRVPDVDPTARVRFVERLQQVSGPAAAKGVEDTALYIYVPLASRNEVGGAPDRPLSNAVARFHEHNRERAVHWPLGLVCTNTHDTKRSADVRARIDALSELPREWERCVRRWRRLNHRHRRTIRGRLAPDTNAEYLLYQTLVAIWPPPRASRRADDLPDRAWRDSARDRLAGYMLKAAREAKLRTSWIDPDREYENALTNFITAVLEPDDDAPFLSDMARLVSRVAALGASNAVARVALHLTSPGTPDLYQGDELWSFSLVDPDNRRPVDFGTRAAALDDLSDVMRRLERGERADLFDPQIKLAITHRLLAFRRTHAELFRRGTYEPVDVTGPRADHVIAFIREHEGERALVAVARLAGEMTVAPSSGWWGNTRILLPHAPRTGVLTSQIIPGEHRLEDSALETAALFDVLPAFLSLL